MRNLTEEFEQSVLELHGYSEHRLNILTCVSQTLEAMRANGDHAAAERHFDNELATVRQAVAEKRAAEKEEAKRKKQDRRFVVITAVSAIFIAAKIVAEAVYVTATSLL